MHCALPRCKLTWPMNQDDRRTILSFSCFWILENVVVLQKKTDWCPRYWRAQFCKLQVWRSSRQEKLQQLQFVGCLFYAQLLIHKREMVKKFGDLVSPPCPVLCFHLISIFELQVLLCNRIIISRMWMYCGWGVVWKWCWVYICTK